MFMAYNFLSSRNTEKLKASLYFSRQDASKHVSGNLKKSILMFDPQVITFDPDTLCSNFATHCFPTHWGTWNKNPAGAPWKFKNVFLAPPPP